MPTPRQHGGAGLLHIPLTTPGFRGLNTQLSSGTLGPEWATSLTNAVIDDNGRIAARKGWDLVTATPAATSAETPVDSGPFLHLIEYVKSNGTTSIIGVSTEGFFESTNGGSTWADITGEITVGDGNWQMVNFNNLIFAARAGQPPIYYDGTGTFTAVADVNAPTGGVIMSGFGRLWITASDGHTVKYSALLDGTDWTSDDSGVVDHWNVWPDNDLIVAMTVFNGVWVVFGRKTVVVWTDGRGSALGVDPLTMYVVDIISGVGALSKYAIQEVDGDMWFLSDYGIQSLARVIRERTNPLMNVSKNVQDYLRDAVANTDVTKIRSVFSPKDRFFLLSLPEGEGTVAGQAIVFDTRGAFEDGSSRCMGVWRGLVPLAAVPLRNSTVLFSFGTLDGAVGKYIGESDNGVSYLFYYETGWFDLTEGYMLLPKRYEGVIFSSNEISVQFRWAFDFDLNWRSVTKVFEGVFAGGEWGEAEWNAFEWGGSLSLRRGHVPASGSGKYVKLSVQSNIEDTTLALQQLDLYFKIGRLV
jgi:hypothetical protein